jgi:hypothetical protein
MFTLDSVIVTGLLIAGAIEGNIYLKVTLYVLAALSIGKKVIH